MSNDAHIHQKQQLQEGSHVRERDGVALYDAPLDLEWYIAERRLAEVALEERARFEALLFDLSMTFVALPTAKADALIDKGLQRVAEFLELDWSTLVEFPVENAPCRAMHMYTAPSGEVMSFDAEWESRIPWLMDRMRLGEIVVLPNLPDDLPATAKSERDYCREVGLRSGLIIPLTAGGSVLGMLGLGSRHNASAWPDDLMPRLRIIGQIFANAVMRKRMEARLQAYTHHLETLVANKVRELELARVKMIQTSKLASLGEMATGVAHELNQPLTAMLFEAEYLKTTAQQVMNAGGNICFLNATELYRLAENLAQDIERSRRITDYLRAFSDISKGDVVRTNLNRAIENSFTLSEARLNQHAIVVQRRLRHDLLPVLANPHKMEQVFTNLISNAEYALEEMARRVKAGEVDLPGYEKILEISSGVENGHVIVRVRDNGCGIPYTAEAHIFEPFFTTKPVGKGSGLGLSTCHGFVTESGGELTFESAENRGTTFTLRFPIAVRMP